MRGVFPPTRGAEPRKVPQQAEQGLLPPGEALHLPGRAGRNHLSAHLQGRPGCAGPEALLLPPHAACPRGPDREAAQLRAPGEVTPKCHRRCLTRGLFPWGVGRRKPCLPTALLAWVFLSGNNCPVNVAEDCQEVLTVGVALWAALPVPGFYLAHEATRRCPRPSWPRRRVGLPHGSGQHEASFLCGRTWPHRRHTSARGGGSGVPQRCPGCPSAKSRGPHLLPRYLKHQTLSSEWSAPVVTAAHPEGAATRSFQAVPKASRQLPSRGHAPP